MKEIKHFVIEITPLVILSIFLGCGKGLNSEAGKPGSFSISTAEAGSGQVIRSVGEES